MGYYDSTIRDEAEALEKDLIEMQELAEKAELYKHSLEEIMRYRKIAYRIRSLLEHMHKSWEFAGFYKKGARFICGKCGKTVYTMSSVSKCKYTFCPFCGIEKLRTVYRE